MKSAVSNLAPALAMAIPLRIARLQAQGGPKSADFDRVCATGELIALRGDILMFGGKGSGEVFNALADAVAVLSFLPGGISMPAFGIRFEEHVEDDIEE